ncbi:hypothetical protein RDWZM_010232 [Blomia tropicalis]|uniref:Alpha-carbonic anhydrase domain-containing protein n=1 Tax=Blomia tropicalis TaxID=40697 RepID=A0A9Q0M1M4_BLOTA|nr:hypothetical protein RDWZM_010232 [Blomia tropicalis]
MSYYNRHITFGLILSSILLSLNFNLHCLFDAILFRSFHQCSQQPSIYVVADWESWWTYEGISGPDFWGRLNPKWSHCSKGNRQSPIDINTSRLLYDPLLAPVRITGDHIRGQLVNTGRGISLLITSEKVATITDGPFSYTYTLSNLSFHFGRENNRGSEHTIDEQQFSGELQLYAYNSQLYANWSEAKREPNGIAAISVLVVLARSPSQANVALKHITNSLKNITKRGQTYTIESFSVLDLLPTLKQYVTYEGSLTQPACHETVQWVILNRPIYISAYQFHMLRHSLKGDGHQDNFRPTQPINGRPIRTNIVSTSTSINNDDNDHQHRNNNHNRPQRQLHQQMSRTSMVIKTMSNEIIDQSNEFAHLLPQFYRSSTVRDAHCETDQLRLYGYRGA